MQPNAAPRRVSRAVWLVPGAILAIALAGAAALRWAAPAGRQPAGPAEEAGVIIPPSSPAPGVPAPPAAPSSPGEALPVVGSVAPDFTLTDLDGETVTLHGMRGRPVLLNFWATWCPPCREEMPRIEAFHRQYGDQIAVIGIDVGEDARAVRELVERERYSWRFLVDPSGAAMQSYLAYAIPVTFFVDADGIIRVKYIGAMTDDQLRDFARQVGVR